MKKPKLLEISENFEDLTLKLKQFLLKTHPLRVVLHLTIFWHLQSYVVLRKLALNVPRDLSISFDGIDVGSMVEPIPMHNCN